MALETKSYEQILGDMIRTFSCHSGSTEVRPGSMIETIFGIMATQIVEMQNNMHMLLVDIQCKSNPKAFDPTSSFQIDMTLRDTKPIDFILADITIGGPVCECGKEKHGFASHSDWCKLFTPNF
jgi:hypothetical protein